MIGVRKTEIGVAWVWYIAVVIAAVCVQFSQTDPFWKNYNFWICIALNVVAVPAGMVFKENFADKRKIRRYAKWPLMFSDSKHSILVNYDIMLVFIITIANLFLYIRQDSVVYQWMMNLIFVLAVVLFLLSYMDKKYGPKEMTRAQQLEERRRKKAEREAQAQLATADASTGTGTAKPAVSAASSNKKKKKYQTKKKK